MAAGLATLQQIEDPAFFDALGAQTRKLVDGLAAESQSANVPLAVEACGGMFGFIFCSDGPVRKFAQVAAADIDRFRKFFHGMLEQGIYLAPSAFEAGFVSAAHGDDEISRTLDAARTVFKSL
jgi:glutamate-1-semialdehyde 2,1-aminomutase